MSKRQIFEQQSFFAAQQIINHKSKFGRNICGLFRSEYERRFARCLEIQKIGFDFERYAFKLKNENEIFIHYIPDFYIRGTSLFIEIQNHMNRRRKHQILMFQEQYKSLNLMLLRSDDVRRYVNCEFDIDFDAYTIKEEEEI